MNNNNKSLKECKKKEFFFSALFMTASLYSTYTVYRVKNRQIPAVRLRLSSFQHECASHIHVVNEDKDESYFSVFTVL